ncbi:hypothetical protein ONZ45_g12963 [Pleurotus djamor]|nr:hypothetical protein ONZ45_g12963 [Pleurotus djamor]
MSDEHCSKNADTFYSVVETKKVEQPSETSSLKEKALVRKLDRRILPLACLLYLFAYLDRSNLGNARLQGLPEDVLGGDPSGVLFDWILWLQAKDTLDPLPNTRDHHLKAVLSTSLDGICCNRLGSTGYNFGGLVVARLFLGIFEAGFGPGIPLYFSFFYTKSEMGVRMAYWFGFAAVAGAFGGLIAFGIQHAHTTIENWRLLFIVEGVPAMLLGVLTMFILPDRPESTSFFNEEERRIAIDRMNRSTSGDVGATVNKAHVGAAFRDWRVYVAGVIYFGLNCALASISAFLPTIIQTFGNSAAISQLLTVPPYAVAAVVLVGFSYASDKLQTRGIFMAIASCIGGIGYLLLLTVRSNQRVRYFATFCITSGTYTTIGIIIAWFAHNLGSETKRATGIPIFMAIGQCGSILGSHIFPRSEGPHYTTLYNLSSFEFIRTTYQVSYRLENSRRDEKYGAACPDAKVDTAKLADKSAAIKAASGESLDAIRALNKLLTNLYTESLKPVYLTLMPVALAGIPSSCPDTLNAEPGLSIREDVASAAISLNSLALLLMASGSEGIPKVNSILTAHHENPFRWLLLIQRFFYQPGVDFHDYYASRPDILVFQVPEILVGFLGFIKDSGNAVGMEAYRHDPLRNCVWELWQRFIPVHLDPTDAAQYLVRELSSALVSMFVLDDYKRGVTSFIDKCHGPVVFAELLLADLEMTYYQAKADKGKTSDVYDCFLQSLRTILGALGSRTFYKLSADIPGPILVRRLTAVTKWTLKDCQRRIQKCRPDEEVLRTIDAIVVMYCQFIFWCTATKDHLPWLDALRSGIVPALRLRLPPNEYIPHEDPEAAEWTKLTCLALTSLSIHLPAVFRYTRRLYSPSPVPSLMSWTKLNSVLQVQLKNDETYHEIGSTIDRCATCKAKPEDTRLRVCSGCHVVKYCSSACQRHDRSNHRFACDLLQLSGSTHPFIRLNNVKGLIMLAYQESAFRHRATYSSIAGRELSAHLAHHPDDIPVIHYTTHASSRRISVNSPSDFPSIFNAHAFRDPTFLQTFKKLYLSSNGKGVCPAHFVVISLVLNPMMDQTLEVLSPLEALAVCGILGREHWVEPPPSSVWFDLWELRYNNKADDKR